MAKTITPRIDLMPFGTTATTVLNKLGPIHSPQTAVRICKKWRLFEPRRSAPELFVVSHGNDFPGLHEELAEHLRGHMRLLLLLSDRGPGEHWIFPDLMGLGIRTSERIHVARLSGEDGAAFMQRFVHALEFPDDAIIDAGWAGDVLIVVAPSFKRLMVPLQKLPPKLRNASRVVRERFELDDCAQFIYWPDLDIHMGWSQFLQAVDPEAKVAAELRGSQFDERYGEVIRELREHRELKQTDIPGLNSRTVRRIEQGKTRVTANAIRKLAKAHGMTPVDYMNELARLLEQE